jgi:uncharacterized protein YjbJ (UPF0337 family)
MTGTLLEGWGRIVADPATILRGQRQQLAGRIQQRHGVVLHHSPLRCAGRA